MRAWGCALACGVAVALGACAPATEVDAAELSLDGTRVAITFDSCNEAEPVEVDETTEQVTVTPSGSGGLIESAGDDCQDYVVVQLAEPLDSRTLINGATGTAVEVASAPPENTVDWPYDRAEVSEAEFAAAIEDMVACLEAEDPLVDAWVTQELNWPGWDVAKEPDANGTVEVPAIAVCEERVLVPLHR
ncbi:hypothetical protein [Demequina sp. NBRC 110056]|uniref:hypothetical protein n=1 Tax=Demequina sp. NBRC 110056 TaxID=1570345 RepID=UPI000A002F93|nr:hypothetical protein [Demequina sp. NBRC 110056]